MIETARKFGQALDVDDFAKAATTLSEDCTYIIGDEVLSGPKAICNSYEQNMLEGRAKFDFLQWGTCRIEDLGNSSYYVHFTDHLGHQGEKYIHRCKQKLIVNDEGLICQITHVQDYDEQMKLKAFKKRVGLL